MKREFFRISTSFIFLAMFIAMSFSAIAQNKVTGTIIDDATGKGVPFVNVGLFRQADSVFVSGAASDDKGVFELLAIPDGAYRLQISAIGYQSFEQMLEVNGNHDMGRLRLQAGVLLIGKGHELLALEPTFVAAVVGGWIARLVDERDGSDPAAYADEASS